MKRIIITFAAMLAVTATAYAAAPDVPWTSVQIPAETEDGPVFASKILAECLEQVAPATLDYVDEVPNDGEQSAQLCVSWTAHEAENDCIRRALVDLVGVGAVIVVVD